MKGLSRYLLIGALTLCGTTAVNAGRPDPPPRKAALPAESPVLSVPGPAVPLPGAPEFRPGIRLDLPQRITVPDADLRSDALPSREEKAVVRPDNPPDRRFFTGVFHRYRPRDPTPSQYPPS